MQWRNAACVWWVDINTWNYGDHIVIVSSASITRVDTTIHFSLYMVCKRINKSLKHCVIYIGQSIILPVYRKHCSMLLISWVEHCETNVFFVNFFKRHSVENVNLKTFSVRSTKSQWQWLLSISSVINAMQVLHVLLRQLCTTICTSHSLTVLKRVKIS